jgi:hypothetical protein
MKSKSSPVSKLCKLALALAFLLLTPSLRHDVAAADDPCAPFPKVCHYTYDPVERCCNADPKFDCFDVCF